MDKATTSCFIYAPGQEWSLEAPTDSLILCK